MIDYGSVVYGSARPSYLKRLDYVHHQALRLSLGAFLTSPIPSLYAVVVFKLLKRAVVRRRSFDEDRHLQVMQAILVSLPDSYAFQNIPSLGRV
ncbi:hypothetical protein AVEN_198711-1 [Araneus ventricosus]|uniref:Uncharacterized protein n=1 Tax=Araneus ventricosus TaxID=182803 RepID=A0A4Y2SXT5_ARAVE|nr:hypothetical protein AVEN_198711-1 [Araneus ventricosus]